MMGRAWAADAGVTGGISRGGGAVGAAGPGLEGPQPDAGEGLTWQSLSLVIRKNPQSGGLEVLFLAHARNDGPQSLPGFWLPWIEGARPGDEAPPQELAWRPGGWYDPRPLAAGERRAYTYRARVDRPGSQGPLRVDTRAPVQQLHVLTREGELLAQADGLTDLGPVDGAALGLPGVRLHVYQATQLGAAVLDIALLPPDTPAARRDGAATGTGPAGAEVPEGEGSPSGGAGEDPRDTPRVGGGATPGTRRPGEMVRWGAGLGGLAAVTAVLAWTWRRRVQGPAGWERRRQRLIGAIVELDQAHQAGELPPDVYERERSRLLQEAVRLTLKIQGSPATTAGRTLSPDPEEGLGSPVDAGTSQGADDPGTGPHRGGATGVATHAGRSTRVPADSPRAIPTFLGTDQGTAPDPPGGAGRPTAEGSRLVTHHRRPPDPEGGQEAVAR